MFLFLYFPSWYYNFINVRFVNQVQILKIWNLKSENLLHYFVEVVPYRNDYPCFSDHLVAFSYRCLYLGLQLVLTRIEGWQFRRVAVLCALFLVDHNVLGSVTGRNSILNFGTFSFWTFAAPLMTLLFTNLMRPLTREK